MKKIFLIAVLIPACTYGQLTVEQIMQDPKWIGTSPSNIVWSYDSKSIYFHWNPEKNTGDSSYSYSLPADKVSKASYLNGKWADDIARGRHDRSNTKICFTHNGDVYVLANLQ